MHEDQRRDKYKQSSYQALVVPQASIKYLTALLLTLCLVILLIFIFVKVPESTRVSGLIYFRSPAIAIRASERGIIADILVAEGQLVNKGAPLISIENENSFLNMHSDEQQRLEDLHVELSNLNTQLENLNQSTVVKTLGMRSELNYLANLLSTQQEREELLIDRRKIMTEEYERVNRIKSALSQSDLDSRRLALLNLENERVILAERRIDIENNISRTENELKSFELESADKIFSINSRKSELRRLIFEAEKRRSYILYSPIQGVIDQINATKGQSVGVENSAGSDLLTIMPQDNEKVLYLLVPPDVRHRLSVGNSVSLNIESTFLDVDQSIKAEINRISESPITEADGLDIPIAIESPAYLVALTIDNGKLQGDLTVPGTRVFANIQLNSISLLTWILN